MPINNPLKKQNKNSYFSSSMISVLNQRVEPPKKRPTNSKTTYSSNVLYKGQASSFTSSSNTKASPSFGFSGFSPKSTKSYTSVFSSNPYRKRPNIIEFIDTTFAYEKLNPMNLTVILSVILSVVSAYVTLTSSQNILSNIAHSINSALPSNISLTGIKIDEKGLFEELGFTDGDENFLSMNEYGDEGDDSSKKKIRKWHDPKIDIVAVHTVKNKEVLSNIAKKYAYLGIDTGTLISYNNLKDVNIKVGQKIRIPNQGGVMYTVKKGETISEIAKRNGITQDPILDANDLKDANIQPGQVLFLPGVQMSTKEYEAKAIVREEKYEIPLVGNFYISSRFGERPNPTTGEPGNNHHGIDLAAKTGTKVLAPKSGRVIFKGYDSSGIYGYYIQIQHKDGLVTVYGHLSKILVNKGDMVKQGAVIGLVGSTGWSTGSHLHFEFRKLRPGGYIRVNPELYVPSLKGSGRH